jgi:hypothetical protein
MIMAREYSEFKEGTQSILIYFNPLYNFYILATVDCHISNFSRHVTCKISLM